MSSLVFILCLSLIYDIILVFGESTFDKEEVVLNISQIYHINRRNLEFYWKNFTGKIPKDAIPGGRDKEGKTTYIGQARLQNGPIIPGQIDRVSKKLFYYYIAVGYGVTENVKILCSEHPEKFEWIKTNVEGLQTLTRKHFVPGGFDDGYPLLIGRANVKGQIVVGKVTIYYKYCGFAYANGEETERKDYEFEILSYNP
ncbi:hypothetical protein ILUMI_12802 [Ignelater luminosus]|uniref:Uncharacterized protein n=1 Tax=Ignelater luminosus TaxID=2038154 RepID=A0A8K0GBZ9_IGNLU|nr:hypothetical protein ILUMI_12802 [Ignelater luminosus]